MKRHALTSPAGEAKGEELLPADVVARRLGVSTKTLARLPIRRLKLGPRMTRYKWSWVEAYIDRAAVA